VSPERIVEPSRSRGPSADGRRALLRVAAAIAAMAATGATSVASPTPPLERAGRAHPLHGIALDVHDGDSFVLRAEDGRRLRIRIAGIDAPELGQPWADKSRRALGDLLRGRRIRVEPRKRDRFDRVIARVEVPDDAGRGVDVAVALLEAGLAWQFDRYADEQPVDERARHARAQRAARDAGRGLWVGDAPEAPWDFRSRARRPEAAPERRPTPGRAG
jgi:endonuclease YncB( thermonuclease family)